MTATSPRKGMGVDWLVATVLHEQSTSVGLAELAELCGDVPKSTVCRAIHRLEARGVADVSVDPVDRRLRIIRPGTVPASAVERPGLMSATAQVAKATS